MHFLKQQVLRVYSGKYQYLNLGLQQAHLNQYCLQSVVNGFWWRLLMFVPNAFLLSVDVVQRRVGTSDDQVCRSILLVIE